MRLTDISPKALREAIEAEAPSSGFLAEDLVKIAEADAGNWHEPQTAEQLMEQQKEWLLQK